MDRERMRCWKWPVIIMKSATVTTPYKVGSVASSKSTKVSLNPPFRAGWSWSAVRANCQQLLDLPRCDHYLTVAFISSVYLRETWALCTGVLSLSWAEYPSNFFLEFLKGSKRVTLMCCYVGNRRLDNPPEPGFSLHLKTHTTSSLRRQFWLAHTCESNRSLLIVHQRDMFGKLVWKFLRVVALPGSLICLV